ncbi:MAG: DUF6057 family protein [Tannerellaceae bacterium]|jgi:hypothetical protein|nr:DUF6057 family protein [Tannerellaceae bacterium]
MKNNRVLAISRPLLFWLAVWGILFALLQACYAFHFYFIEQNQLFLSTGYYLAEKAAAPGGFTLWLSEWLVQFFILPYAGAAITAGLLTLAGVCTEGVIRRVAPRANLFILPLLPVVALLCIHFSNLYMAWGTVSYVLALFFLFLTAGIARFSVRLGVAVFLTALLFWLAGSVYVLYALSVAVIEALHKGRRIGFLPVLPAEAFVLGASGVYFSLFGAYRFAFFPDIYYNPLLKPEMALYYSWIVLLAVPVMAYMAGKGRMRSVKRAAGESAVQVLLLAALCWWSVSSHLDSKSYKVKELSYYARTEQWDRILERCKGRLTNYLPLCYVNMALAQKGELADKMFAYDQHGLDGLLVNKNQMGFISGLLNEVYFTMNAIALSQQMAFDAYVCSPGEGCPDALKRLVQTNLIYGAYPVAEKYICLLEETFYYGEWATAHRRFLYHDAEVEKDPLLGNKRRALAQTTALHATSGLDMALLQAAEANPSDKASIHYAGAFYLLSKRLDLFQQMIERYYGTETLPALPASFQEAVIILSEQDQEYWKRFDISEAVIRRFAEYKRTVVDQKRNSQALPGLMSRAYGDTYWFYFMFK